LITIKHSPILATLLLLCSCYARQEEKAAPAAGQDMYSSLAVQQDGKDTGVWGYVVFHNDKLMIQQFTIPALEGNKHFAGKEQAALVGNLVAEKLNHAKHPGITKKELDSLGIIPLHDVTNEK
jgi:hypothetical protein